jgi:hypothetical protein
MKIAKNTDMVKNKDVGCGEGPSLEYGQLTHEVRTSWFFVN